MVAGHLREQNGYYQMVLNWKGKDGKRKSKSISTRLTVEGNPYQPHCRTNNNQRENKDNSEGWHKNIL